MCSEWGDFNLREASGRLSGVLAVASIFLIFGCCLIFASENSVKRRMILMKGGDKYGEIICIEGRWMSIGGDIYTLSRKVESLENY